jgi:predicted DNA-binding transcriptional regulator AlpA
MDAAAEPAGIETQSLTLTTSGLANMLGVHPRTIQRMRTAGEGPKPIGVRGALRYRRKDVERWLEGRRR